MTAARPATQLRLLGDPALVTADGGLRALERRAAALCALVALEPGVTRARAASLVWPDSDNARQALRQQLARFRRIYGLDLLVGDDALTVAPGVAVDAVDAPDAAAVGELLGTLAYDDCDDLQQWLDRQRAARRSASTGGLLARLAQAEAEGDLDAALALAEQLLLADNASEAHHRTLMRLHYLRGDIAQAESAYQRLVRDLAQRFGARPSAETEQLARALRAARPTPEMHTALPSAGATASRPVPVTVLRPPRMIGRERELAGLGAAWSQGRAALLLGEPGLGKSRLLAEFTAGRRVLGVQGRPGDAGVPYALLSRLLRRILERNPVELPPPRRNELSRLLPELVPTLPLPAEGQRLLLQGAVEAVLAQAGDALDGLIVDDLHFADDASVEMLQALICGSEAAGPLVGLRWALAQRPGEGSAAAAALRAALEESQAIDVLPLSPLTEAEMAALIDSLGLPELDSAQLAPQLARHSGGNPLYALETLKLGLASGLLRQGRLPTPTNVGALIERRLKQLSERALALARVAAIAGVDFSIALAEEVMGVRAVELADAWAELEAAQVLREQAFAHDLVHDAVLRSVPAAIARHLHAAVAARLETGRTEPARIATHWHAAERWREAAAQWSEAAVRARLASRREEELQLLERAADCHARSGDRAREFEVLRQAASAIIYVDVGARAERIGERLMALAGDDLQRAQALNEIAFIDQSRGDRAACERHAREALLLSERVGRPDLAFYAARSVSVALAAQGREAEALAVIDPHRAWVEAHGSDENRCEFLADRSWALTKLSRLHEARDSLQQALALAERSGHQSDVGSVLHLLASVENRLGLAASAITRLQRAIALQELLGHHSGVHGTQQLLLGALLRDQGRYGEALTLLHAAVSQLTEGSTIDFAAGARLALMQTWLDLGQAARAQQALPAVSDAWSPGVLGAWHLRRGHLARALGRDLGRSGEDDYAAGLAALGDDIGATATNVRGALLVHLSLARRDAQAFERVAALAAQAREGQAYGLAIVALAAAARVARDREVCGQYAAQVEQLMADGYSPESAAPTFIWWLLADAARAHGDAATAKRLATRGAEWIDRVARQAVPAEYRESFTHRNEVHRGLLEAARMQAGGARLPPTSGSH